MPDRDTITIPAPIARPGERVEMRGDLRWYSGTIFDAAYHVEGGKWRYQVKFKGPLGVSLTWVAAAQFRRMESGS